MEELGHKGELTLSVNAFVPKPFTPYQWSPLEEVKELKQRFKQLQNGLKKERRIRLLTESLKETVLQAALARGDRRLSAVLLLAAREEIGLKDAFRRAEIDPADFACRSFPLNAPLPWDHLDMGVTKTYLLQERERSFEGKFTPMCFDGCSRCGVCESKISTERRN